MLVPKMSKVWLAEALLCPFTLCEIVPDVICDIKCQSEMRTKIINFRAWYWNYSNRLREHQIEVTK